VMRDASEGGRFTKPIKAWATSGRRHHGVIEGVITDEDGNPFAGHCHCVRAKALRRQWPGGSIHDCRRRLLPVVPEDTRSKSRPRLRRTGPCRPQGRQCRSDFKINSGCRSPWTSALRRRRSGFAIVKAPSHTRYGKPAPG